MSNVEKVTIALTPEMAGFIRHAVDAGEYASTSEAIRHAVREWKERRDLLGYTVEELRGLAQEGLQSGPAVPLSMEDIKAEARRRLEASSSRIG
jgi:antitoxin ParD1/3/4